MELSHLFFPARQFTDPKTAGADPRSADAAADSPAPSFADIVRASGIASLFAGSLERRFKVVAVIPAYNEDRFIASVVLKTHPYVDAVIIIDDGSTDLTATLAEAAGAIVVRHAHNLGKSAAINTGLRVAYEMGVEAAVLLDGDGQHHPDDIPHLVERILAGQADIVVGSRFMRAGNRIPRWRAFGQHTLTAVTNVLSGLVLTDSQSGFRALSSRAIRAMHFEQRGFAVESEMQFQAREHGLTMIEAPIGVTYAERSKRNPVKHALQVINGVLGIVGQHRPLLFFSLPGLTLLIAGIAVGLRVMAIYLASSEFAIGHALLAVLFTILGALSLFAGITLHSVRGLLLQHDQRQRDR